MKLLVTLLAIGVLATIAIADGPKDGGDAAVGKRAYSKSCANCHFVPDPTIERDKVWLGLIKTTA